MIVSSIMAQIGKYKLGIAPLYMIAVFFLTSICAVVAAIPRFAEISKTLSVVKNVCRCL